MTYVFEFDKTDPTVWVTTQEYWDRTGYFDDTERGKNFPEPLKTLLVCVMDACFEWQKIYKQKEIRQLLIEHGWKEIESGFQ